MKNFDCELDVQGVTRLISTTTVSVEENVKVIHQPSTSRSYLGKTDWAWDDLRDYVVAEVEQRFGTFPRDSRKEAAIFKSFLSRWPEKAQAIAKYAFEVEDGRWAGAPISINRFCKGSDPYFSEKIVERVVETPVAKW